MAAGEDFVQCLGPERRALRHFSADLFDVLLPALFDLVLEQLRQRAVTNPLLSLLRMINQHVRDQSPRQPPGFLLWILHHERVDRTQRAGVTLAPCAWGGSTHRRRGGGRWG